MQAQADNLKKQLRKKEDDLAAAREEAKYTKQKFYEDSIQTKRQELIEKKVRIQEEHERLAKEK